MFIEEEYFDKCYIMTDLELLEELLVNTRNLTDNPYNEELREKCDITNGIHISRVTNRLGIPIE